MHIHSLILIVLWLIIFLVSPEKDGLLAIKLVLSEHYSKEGNPYQTHSLSPIVEELANDVQDGTFITPSQFFIDRY